MSIKASHVRPISLRPTLAHLSARRCDCLAGRTLVAVARQRKGLDAGRCQLVFEHLETSALLQLTLRRPLADHRLSELQFGALVAMFARDPDPVAPADLADFTAVSRAAITDALVRLVALKLVSRRRGQADRRVYHLHLTSAGRNLADEAMMSYLRAVGDAARHVDPKAQKQLRAAYGLLQQGAGHIAR